ncbi:MAG: helix-turn-helix domain-containing protein [Flavobacteriaceae bacterium]
MLYSWLNPEAEIHIFLRYSQGFSLLFSIPIVWVLLKHYWKINENTTKTSDLGKKDKYGKTGLSKSFSLELKNRLEYLMTDQKLYLQHQLKLDDIAELLDISRHHASQVINENFQVSFYDYINAFRVEDAKRQLSSNFDGTKSISDLAYECGFNNRVSFYKAFKKITLTTPIEYMEKKVA